MRKVILLAGLAALSAGCGDVVLDPYREHDGTALSPSASTTFRLPDARSDPRQIAKFDVRALAGNAHTVCAVGPGLVKCSHAGPNAWSDMPGSSEVLAKMEPAAAWLATPATLVVVGQALDGGGGRIAALSTSHGVRFDDPGIKFLNAVHGQSGTHAVAVGQSAAGDAGLAVAKQSGWVGSGALLGKPALMGITTSADGAAIAVGAAGIVLTSADGKGWQAVETPTSVTLRAVWSNGDMAIAVGDLGTIIERTDKGWVLAEVTFGLDNVNWRAIDGANKRVFAAGRRSGRFSRGVLAVRIGDEWRQRSLPTQFDVRQLSAVAVLEHGDQTRLAIAGDRLLGFCKVSGPLQGLGLYGCSAM